MTFFGMALLTAAGTVVLAAFAIVTARYARKAFREQSKEVAAIERQVSDGQELARQQAALLEVQAGQLEVLRAQLEDQRKASAAQAEVLELQGADLRESLEERKREAEDRRQAQAAQVSAWFAWDRVLDALIPGDDWGATVRNASGLPIFDLRIGFDWISEQPGGQGWVASPHGSLPQPIRILPPGSTRHFQIPAQVRSQDPRCDDEVIAVSITFTDAAGNRWERDPRGALKPLS